MVFKDYDIKIVAFSDIHGNVDAFKETVNFIRTLKGVDYILIAGDIADWPGPEEAERAFRDLVKMFRLLEELNIKYFFVLGNWDIFFVEDLLNARNLNLHRISIEEELKEADSIFREILRQADSKNGVLLDKSAVHMLNKDIKLTSNPALVDSKTIFLIHAYKTVRSDALLHIEGHWGLYAQLNKSKNYLNLGFIYGGGYRGYKGLKGCLWEIIIKDVKVAEIKWHNLGGALREFYCPIHKEEGLFIIPSHWKECPICHNPQRARFTRSR
ncbi:MAG: metallophosphoesterase [Zestosphaera sp.]